VAGCYEHGSKPSCSIKGGYFLTSSLPFIFLVAEMTFKTHLYRIELPVHSVAGSDLGIML
jgi:hypothetical protein